MVAALAEASDVVELLGRPLTQTEGTQVDALLREASALVIGYTGPIELDAGVLVPEPIRGVVARMVARVLQQSGMAPVGVESGSLSAGPFAQSVKWAAGASSGGPWLSASDKLALRPYRSGMGSVHFGSPITGRFRWSE